MRNYEEEIREHHDLDFSVEERKDGILKWCIEIGGVYFECQSNTPDITHAYALAVWEEKEFLPLLHFLKSHEDELKEFVEKYNGGAE